MPTHVLSTKALEAIHAAVEQVFARAKIRMLGRDWGPKQIIIGSATEHRPDLSIPGLFDASSKAERIKPDEKLKDSINQVIEGYLDAYQETAKARIVHAVQNFLHDSTKGPVDTTRVLGGELATLMADMTHNVRRLAETESTRAKNLGAADAISKVNTIVGVKDPTIYFVVIRDNRRCGECTRLHLLDNKITPRVWKMSEIGAGHHTKGDSNPKMAGPHPNCFTGSQRLHTDSGLLTFKELFDSKILNKVLVDNRVKNRKVGNNQHGADILGKYWFDRHASGTRTLDATPVYDTGVQPCLRITLNTGTAIEVSYNHEMWVDNNKDCYKIAAQELKVGDKIPLLSGEGLFGNDNFPELAELMGHILGDGSLGEIYADFNFFGADIEYGRDLLELARPFCGNLVSELIVFPPNEKYAVPRAKFHSQKLRNQLIAEFGLSKTPRRVPARIWGANKRTITAFLRGLYAADGCSWNIPSVVLNQNNKEFLHEIQLLLSNLGLKTTLTIHDKEEKLNKFTYANGDIHYAKYKKTWRLILSGHRQLTRFANEIGFGVPAKQNILEERLRKATVNSQKNNWRTSRIVSIEDIGEQQTYCITEPMTNTISVNGIVTGNCRCSLVSLLSGYGFNEAGKVEFKEPGWDEFTHQRGLKTK